MTAVPPVGAEHPSALASGLTAAFVAALPGATSHAAGCCGAIGGNAVPAAKMRVGT